MKIVIVLYNSIFMTLFQNFTVLRDELLPVRELSTFHSVQLSISSYGLKTFSHRPKLLFDFYEKRWKITKIKFLERKTLQDEFLHLWGLSGWNSRHFVTWSKTPFPLWSKKQDVWESFFLVGPIFNQKRPFLFEVDFFLVRLIFDEKRPFFLGESFL